MLTIIRAKCIQLPLWGKCADTIEGGTITMKNASNHISRAVKICGVASIFGSSLMLVACSDSEQASYEAANDQLTISDTAKPELPMLTIDGGQLAGAIFQGKDDFGKSKEEYFLEFQRGQTVTVTNSFVYGKDTSSSSSDAWYIYIGYNSPAIVCKQTNSESKRVLLSLNKRLEQATVVGRFEDIVMDRVYLYDCTISGGQEI